MDLGIDFRDDPPRRPAPARKSPAPPRFGLADAMILVAATAFGLMADRGLQSYPGWPGLSALFAPPDLEFLPGHAYGFLLSLFIIPYPLMTAWTLAVAACGLRQGRPSWRRLSARPGWVAALALVPTLAGWALVATASLALGGGLGLRVLAYLPIGLGASVAAAWANLLVARRWRPEPSWVDRAGRAFGAYWIAAALLGLGFLVAFR